MALAAVVDDKAWYAVDVYERRQGALVKAKTYGPYNATHDECRSILRRLKQLEPKGKLVCQVWNAAQTRWTRLT